MAEEYSWDSYLNDRLLATNQVSGAGLASEEDGVVYACVAQGEESDPNFDIKKKKIKNKKIKNKKKMRHKIKKIDIK
ncbi:profilin [Plasmodium falciparum NF135/5.C10]|uniref:Profilin n=1 Tax=Plasmodium falciparum NF135/5.C10 TaxID=1036726 RepID=W4IGL5_PLAFA|nr:profilin [Plasmodium falciparum NF135/5.C10]